jgi:hypothetical protein
MKKLSAKMFYEFNDLGKSEPYLILNQPYIDDDGSLKKIIKPENIGLVRDNIYMDMPIIYYKLNLIAIEILKKNNWMCEVELDGDGKLKKVDGLVLMVVK